MKSKNEFMIYALAGVLLGCAMTVLALLFSGAGHSPHIEFLIVLVYLGLWIAALSAIVFFTAVVVRIFNAIKREG